MRRGRPGHCQSSRLKGRHEGEIEGRRKAEIILMSTVKDKEAARIEVHQCRPLFLSISIRQEQL